ncbi:MAG: hypothetical protein M1826_001041 [Phylliscum demangeonii]|nr:MAG: hypothetical protein M1826_001041 [Phylliscum demangeonii]
MAVRHAWKPARKVGGLFHAGPGRRHGLGRAQSSVARPSEPGRPTPLNSILIANRGEIAFSPFAVNVGEPSAYLNGDRIIEIAQREGCQAIHPGYGFLSENAGFARKCTEAGIIFIGPPWQAIEAMGSKSASKEIMTAAGVACIPGYHGAAQEAEVLQREAALIGYPVMLKAVKGGGGKGMRIVRTAAAFGEQLTSARSEARNAFGDDRMLVEKYLRAPRHIEVQIFADQHGHCVALGERDCSLQRRHQKILEESPAPRLPAGRRRELWAQARAAALAVGYEGAGTVEFIVDTETGDFFFMEMNTRLQVEHPVTEMVTGLDLVHWQFLVAQGAALPLTQPEIDDRIARGGWAMEARIYAEDPARNFMPDSGPLVHLRIPRRSDRVRVDAGFVQGDEISPYYDPMMAKLIVRGATRHEAIQKLGTALAEYEVVGPKTNIEFLQRICAHPRFIAGDVETGFIAKHHDELFAPRPAADEVFVQAALAALLAPEAAPTANQRAAPHLRHHAAAFGDGGVTVGFGSDRQQQRELVFIERGSRSSDSSGNSNGFVEEEESVSVVIRGPRQKDSSSHRDDGRALDGPVFDIQVLRRRPRRPRTPGPETDGGSKSSGQPPSSSFANVTCICRPLSQSGSESGSGCGAATAIHLTTFYPHARIDSTIVRHGLETHIFQRGVSVSVSVSASPPHDDYSNHYILVPAPPRWLHAAAARHSIHSATTTTTTTTTTTASTTMDSSNNSKIVTAPMPCKVLRVEVAEGERVRRDQALVVIESMKMETVVRSPVDGVVEREMCKAGSSLVEFA